MQYDFHGPRPIRPRSWWSWERPKRSACSINISVAFGTSIPTSITVVETRTWISPALKRRMIASFSSNQPSVEQPHGELGEDVLLEMAGHVRRRLQVDHFRLLHE